MGDTVGSVATRAAPLGWMPSNCREQADDLFMIADDLQVRACCLLRLAPNDTGSVTGSVMVARGLADEQQDVLIRASATMMSGATSSGPQQSLPWVLDKQNGLWGQYGRVGAMHQPVVS